jgi:GNAT superfamily N-acetyltransferase
VNRPDNRGALRNEIAEAAIPPGLLAYVAGRPVGWTRVGPRSGLAGVGGNRALARVLAGDLSERAADGVWWVACFAVESQHRRSGVGSALLVAAVDYARRMGPPR